MSIHLLGGVHRILKLINKSTAIVWMLNKSRVQLLYVVVETLWSSLTCSNDWFPHKLPCDRTKELIRNAWTHWITLQLLHFPQEFTAQANWLCWQNTHEHDNDNMCWKWITKLRLCALIRAEITWASSGTSSTYTIKYYSSVIPAFQWRKQKYLCTKWIIS